MDRNPKQKVDDCAKILAYSKEEKVSLGQQVLATGIFEPGEVNRDINQIIKRRMPMFEHEKKISGRASIGEISSVGQALDYVVQKVAATPTTGRFVIKNYVKLLQDRGHEISGSGLKEASRPSKKKRLEAPKPPVERQKVDNCAKMLAYNPANKNGKLGQRVLATGIFQPGEVDRDLNQKIKKRMPVFEHQKKISDRASIGDIADKDEAIKYAARKVAATPTTGRYVSNNYANMLKENGYSFTRSAIKMASLKSQVVESPQEWTTQSQEEANKDEPAFPDQCTDQLKGLVRECIVEELMPHLSNTLPFVLEQMIHFDFDYEKVEKILMRLVGNIHAHREAELTNLLEGRTEVEVQMQLDVQQNRNEHPTLSCYQIPYHDPRVRSNLLRELYDYNYAETGSSTMRFDHRNSVSTALVTIPQSSSLDSMKRSDYRHDFVAEIMNNLDKDGDKPEETRKDFLKMLARSDDCRDHFREVAHSEGLSLIERLDEETSFAIQSDANLSNTQMRALSRNLLAAFGTPIFSGERKTKLALGSVVPHVDIGCFVDGRKSVRWNCKRVDQVLLLFLDTLVESDVSNFDHMDISISIDHGKGFLRASLVVLLRGMDSKVEMAGCFALASAKCKGDSYKILQGTFAPKINEALHRIKNSGYKVSLFCRPDGPAYSKLGTEPEDESHDSIQELQVEQFIAGDLKFFMMATGREHADRVWCFYCDMMNKEWKSEPSKVGEEWSNEALTNHVESMRDNYTSLNAFDKKGCKIDHLLMFDAIDFDHFVPPVLHILLGLVNDIYKNLLAELQAGYEVYTDAYVKLESEWAIAAATHRNAKDEKAEHERLYGNYAKYLKVSCFFSTQIQRWHLSDLSF
jgi:hypothetical protein